MTSHSNPSPYAGLTMAEAIQAVIEDGHAEAEAERQATEQATAEWYGEDR